MKEGTNTNIACVKIEAKSGTQIGPCIRDAIILAMTENVAVTLTHNDKTYTVEPGQLVDLISNRPTGNPED